MSHAGWWSGGHEPLSVWSSGRDDAGHVVVVLPPVGYAFSSTSRFVTALAEDVARRGSRALVVDHPGTADSFGELGTQEAAVGAAAGLVRALGSSGVRISLVGFEWGATVAAALAGLPGVVDVALIAPIGARWARQQRLLGLSAPGGGVSVGGYLLPDALLTTATPPAATAVPTLTVTSADGPAELLDGPVTAWSEPTLREVLERPAEEAVVDPALVARLGAWATQRAGEQDAAVTSPLRLDPRVRADGVAEEVVPIGRHRLPGWRSVGTAQGTLVLLNSGSDPHTGPGRAWVELAREVARAGGPSVVRFDCRGWGRSPSASGDGRPYDELMTADVEEAVRDLAGPVVVAGLCAGAWVALDLARRPPVGLAGVIAVNPQLYWERGHPVEARIADTVARRAQETAAIAEAAAAGVWDREDAAGERNAAGAWLDELAAGAVAVTMLFGQDDPGRLYLDQRLRRRLGEAVARGVVVQDLPDLDHGLHAVWQRPVLTEAVLAACERSLRATATATSTPGP